MDNIYIIIPVKQSFVKKDCFWRLLLNCFYLKKLGINHILVADCSAFMGHWLVFFVAKITGCRYIHQKQSKFYSPAKIKNYAAKYVFENLLSEFVLFLDVDVYINRTLINLLKENISLKLQFDWFPVVFLVKHISSLRFINNISSNNYIVREKDILQIGYSTGIQLFYKSFFYKINGFDENYEGYGCEDIDMLHRATLFLGVRNQFSEKYYLDIRSHVPDELDGFRKFFYQIKKNTPLRVMPIHLWHKRKNKSNYMKNRNRNDQLLIYKMKNFDLNYISNLLR